jgi:hypothetical protein
LVEVIFLSDLFSEIEKEVSTSIQVLGITYELIAALEIAK